MAQTNTKAYAQAGVDIALADRLLAKVKPDLKAASRPEVLGGIGAFGGLFDISRLGLKQPVLVASTDSVGTKVKVATLAQDWRNLGTDIVHHCANDIAVMGAKPLFFLDYFAANRLEPKAYVQVMRSLARACQQGDIALLGGETAELPGVYAGDELDLVGTIVGMVDRNRILTGEGIKPGDTLIGVASNGLHTNGYSLARKVFFEQLKLSPTDTLPGARAKVGKALLQPHTLYAPALLEGLRQFNSGRNFSQRKDNGILAAAHITGGGLPGNLNRVLPETVDAVIETRAWPRIPLFKALAVHAECERDELYEVFNMGIGLVLVAQAAAAEGVLAHLQAQRHKAWPIGQTVKGSGVVQLLH